MKATSSRLALCLPLLASLRILAGNEVANGGFEGGLNSWGSAPPSTSLNYWDTSLECCSVPGSGSAHIQIRNSDGLPHGLLQCVPATSGVAYDFGERVYISPDPSVPPGSNGFGMLRIRWMNNSTCGNGPPAIIATTITPVVTTPGIWLETALRSQIAPAGTAAALVEPSGQAALGGSVDVDVDAVSFGPSADGLSLRGSRYFVQGSYRLQDGRQGPLHFGRLTDASGIFYFDDPNDVQAVIKVLDACDVNARFWVFAGGSTDQEVHLSVLDRATGQVKSYDNPLKSRWLPIQDTDAFATCGSTLNTSGTFGTSLD